MDVLHKMYFSSGKGCSIVVSLYVLIMPILLFFIDNNNQRLKPSLHKNALF